MEVKSTLSRVYKWEYFWLCVIVIATLAMHFSIVTNPNDLVLDEQHYVKDARSIIVTQVDQRPEHPPLAKLFIVGGIDALGDNPWGWRVPSIIFGTIGIILFYFICRKLNMSRRASSIATFLLGLENFTFMMNSIAMLDVFFVTLTLAFFLLYLYREYFCAGYSSDWPPWPSCMAHWPLRHCLSTGCFPKRNLLNGSSLTIISAPIVFIALMPLFDFALTRQFHNPIDRVKEMLTLSGTLDFHQYCSSGIEPSLGMASKLPADGFLV